jgi:hypothetical protein
MKLYFTDKFVGKRNEEWTVNSRKEALDMIREFEDQYWFEDDEGDVYDEQGEFVGNSKEDSIFDWQDYFYEISGE